MIRRNCWGQKVLEPVSAAIFSITPQTSQPGLLHHLMEEGRLWNRVQPASACVLSFKHKGTGLELEVPPFPPQASGRGIDSLAPLLPLLHPKPARKEILQKAIEYPGHAPSESNTTPAAI